MIKFEITTEQPTDNILLHPAKHHLVSFMMKIDHTTLKVNLNDAELKQLAEQVNKQINNIASEEALMKACAKKDAIKKYKYWVDLEGGICFGTITTTETDVDTIKKLALEDASEIHDVSRAYVYKISVLSVD